MAGASRQLTSDGGVARLETLEQETDGGSRLGADGGVAGGAVLLQPVQLLDHHPWNQQLRTHACEHGRDMMSRRLVSVSWGPTSDIVVETRARLMRLDILHSMTKNKQVFIQRL